MDYYVVRYITEIGGTSRVHNIRGIEELPNGKVNMYRYFRRKHKWILDMGSSGEGVDLKRGGYERIPEDKANRMLVQMELER